MVVLITEKILVICLTPAAGIPVSPRLPGTLLGRDGTGRTGWDGVTGIVASEMSPTGKSFRGGWGKSEMSPTGKSFRIYIYVVYH